MKLSELFETSIKLSDADKARILDDIESWSGGFNIYELDNEQIDNYIEHSLDAKFDQQYVRRWLTDMIEHGSDDGDYVVSDIHHNPDDISALVFAGNQHLQPTSRVYYGINVVFVRGGDVELITDDDMSEWQAKNHKDKIIAVAKKEISHDKESAKYLKQLGH